MKNGMVLFSRLFLFFIFQMIFVFIYYLLDKSHPLERSANWWPISVTITNLICLFMLVRLFKKEGKSYFSIFKIKKIHLKQDLKSMIIILILLAPIAFLPNILIATALFHDYMNAVDLLVRPLPYAVAIISIVIFPITQGLAEIPLYFSYVMPNLPYKRWIKIGLPSLVLSLQHIAIPFLLNLDFILWRGLMFLPFAIFLGVIMYLKPRLLPYLAIIHVLMDSSFAILLLTVAY